MVRRCVLDGLNKGIAEGLTAALRATADREAALIARRVEVEEKLRLDAKSRHKLLNECRCWENQVIFVQNKIEDQPVKYFCRRVGATFLRVTLSGAGQTEPTDLARVPGQVVKTKLHREIDILGAKLGEFEVEAQGIREALAREREVLLSAFHVEQQALEQRYARKLELLDEKTANQVGGMWRRMADVRRFKERVLSSAIRCEVILPAGGTLTSDKIDPPNN
jgi:hypothetical protein